MDKEYKLKDRAPSMQAEQDSPDNEVHETELEIRNSDGLHMRPAMRFVDVANRFESDIAVSHGETNVNGKSIMEISMLAATKGAKLKVRASGSDARAAVDALRELVEDPQFDGPTPK
jgi:phosphotransferase system HPr (HPr) family protein